MQYNTTLADVNSPLNLEHKIRKENAYSPSLQMASCKCLRTIRCFLSSRASPTSSRISIAKCSRAIGMHWDHSESVSWHIYGLWATTWAPTMTNLQHYLWEMSTIRSRFVMKMLTLRRYEWQVASAFVQYVASCHHEQRCLSAQEFWLPGVPEQ